MRANGLAGRGVTLLQFIYVEGFDQTLVKDRVRGNPLRGPHSGHHLLQAFVQVEGQAHTLKNNNVHQKYHVV